MLMLNRVAAALIATVALQASPAVAADVTPFGELFTEYTVNAGDALGGTSPLRNTFSITRTWLGLRARYNDDFWGVVNLDTGPNAAGRLDVFLRHGFADVSLFGLGRMRGGQFNSLWIIPVEEEWLPFRYTGLMFTHREALFPLQDRGIMWYGGDRPLELAMAVFNGEGATPAPGDPGEGAGGHFTKAYEARLRSRPIDGLDLAMLARVADAPPGVDRRNTLVGGGNVHLGPVVVGGEAALNAVIEGKTGAQTTGMGGSVHLFLPRVVGNYSPMVRADYFDANPASAASNAHLRLIAVVGYEWIPNVDTALVYEYTSFLKTATVPPDQQIGIKSGLRF